MKPAREYSDAMYLSVMRNWVNLFMYGCPYHGQKGALRLAQDYGRGLADFPEKDAESEIKGSYSLLCVRAYHLRPPIDAKKWIGEIRKAIKEMS